jgi:hypothetical protein
MRALSFLLALAGCGTGLWAALKWYNASRVELDFPLDKKYPDRANSRIPDEEQLEIDLTFVRAIAWSAELNKWAAIWTGPSTALNGLAVLANTLT